MTTVIALGGNALTRLGERGTAAEQLANLCRVLPALAPLLGDRRVAITHGNGPQVGNELVRQERARRRGSTAAALRRGRADAGRDRRADASELRPVTRGLAEALAGRAVTRISR